MFVLIADLLLQFPTIAKAVSLQVLINPIFWKGMSRMIRKYFISLDLITIAGSIKNTFGNNETGKTCLSQILRRLLFFIPSSLFVCRVILGLFLLSFILSPKASYARSFLGVEFHEDEKGARQVDQSVEELRKSKYKDLPFAEKQAEKILQEAQRINYSKGAYEVTLQLAHILQLQNKNDTALTVIQELLRNEGMKKHEDASTFILLGNLQQVNNQIDSALASYQVAENMLPQNGAERNRALIYSNRATIESNRGKYKEAVDNYLKSIEIREQNNLMGSLPVDYENVSRVFLTMNNYEKAIEYLEKAISLCKANGNDYYLASALGTLGHTYERIDSLEKAVEYLNQALPLAEKVNDPTMITEIYTYLGYVYLKTREYDRALSSFQNTLSLSKEIDFDSGIINGLYESGMVYKLKGDYKQAATYMQKVFDFLSDKQNFSYKVADVYEQLAAIYYQTEDAGKNKSYEYLQKYHAIKDSILGVEQQLYILELEKKYETEKREREVLLLEKKTLRLFVALLFTMVSLLLFMLLFIRNRYLRKIAQRSRDQEKERNEHIAEILEVKKRELFSQANQLLKIQEQGERVLERIQQVIHEYEGKDSPLSRKVRSYIQKAKSEYNVFGEFEKRLEENNEEFHKNLLDSYPELSSTELKVCGLLRMGLSTKEISQVTHRSPRTIDFTRNQIRKKMNLDANDNLYKHLIQI